MDDNIERPSEDPGAVGAMLEIGVEPAALDILVPAGGGNVPALTRRTLPQTIP